MCLCALECVVVLHVTRISSTAFISNEVECKFAVAGREVLKTMHAQ